MSDSTDTVALPVTQQKTSFCVGCPAEAKGCVLKGRWVPDARMTLLVEAPTWPNLNTGNPFTDQNGKLLKKLIAALEQKVGRDLPVNVAYASGAMGKPSAEVLSHCAELWKSQWSTHFGQQTGPHVIVPLGLPAAKGVGLSGKKILDIRGRMQQRVIGTRNVFVIPTLSLNALYTKPGLAEVVQQDLLRAAKTAYLDEYVPPKTIEELSKGYVFPKTLEDVKKVCDDVIAYFDPEKQNSQWDWPIAVDIETNTLKAFRRDAKVLMISFGWDDGKATAILLNHPENKFYDPAAAWAEVRRVLECAKPKVFHNCKFDLQFLERVAGVRVHNVTWDTMCGQHWISEDQKGVYGLKALAPSYAPEYEGYEEKLHEALRHGEEAAPTEEDVLKEAKELAATTADAGNPDTSWLEGAEDLEDEQPEDEDETPPNNDCWLAEPEWLEGTKDEDKAAYREARDAWFAFDQVGKGKERGQALRKWKKWAKLLSLPEPDPIPLKELKKALSEWEAVAIDTIMPYAAADADVTRIVFKKQWRRLRMLDVSDDAKRVMDDLYLPGARALGALEFRGAKVNLELAAQYDTQLTDLITSQQDKLHNLAFRHFKINAPKQLAEVLLSLGFRSLGSTKGGQMKTGKDVLITYQKECVDKLAVANLADADRSIEDRRLEFVESLLLYKAATKMKSSFLKRLREYSGLDGHIHTTFHLTGTSTGRLSSSKLNLQNLPLYMCRITRPNLANPDEPIVIHEGFNVKALLVPEDDSEVFWNLDIKAAEIRVAAYYSGDKALIDALTNGLDIHTFFLTKIKHPELEGEALQEQYKAYKKLVSEEDPEITKFRTAVKRVVFGTLYGAGPRKIAAQIGNGYTDVQAKELISGLFKAFPGLKDYIDATKSEINARSRTKTVFGRFRRFLLAGVNNELKSKAEREGVNFRIQSTSSDLVLSQLCEINQHLDEIEAVMRLTVHDSMAGTVKKSRVHEMKAFFDYWLVQRVKERFPWLPVPFDYDLEIGPNYGEKEKYKKWLELNPPVAAAA